MKTLNGNSRASDFVDGMVHAEEAYSRANPGYADAPFYTNHDMDRSATYYPSDKGPVTKMAYAMDLLMAGNAFVYYGEEIGMNGSGRDENRRAPMYWSDNPQDPDKCTDPPYMEEIQMKFPSVDDQMNDEQSLYSWFKSVIRVRNTYPAIAKGSTKKADAVCDDKVAAFFRGVENEDELLIVMNLRGQTVTKDISSLGKSYRLAESLSTNEESITYKNGEVSLPAYSIAVFTHK